MEHAIATLYVALNTVVNNAPINRDSGNYEQAELEQVVASQLRRAISVLQRHKDADTTAGE